MAGVIPDRARHPVVWYLLFLFLAFVVIAPGAQSRHHHHRNKHRNRHRPTAIVPIEPSLKCGDDFSATISTGSYAKIYVEGANVGDQLCRSQREFESVTFNLITDCGVQKSLDSVYNFTIIARRYMNIATDGDRRIPMKCTFHLTGEAVGNWNVLHDPDTVTQLSGLIIHENEDEDEDIDLYLDPAPVGNDVGDQPSHPADGVIHQKRTGNNLERKDVSFQALPANMIASEREMEAASLLTKDVLPDGRFVFRPAKFWYLAPLLAAVVFVSIFILVVYVRQKERSRKLLRLSTKKRLAMARTPTLEDIRAIVGEEQQADCRQPATPADSAINEPADVEQVAAEIDMK